MKRKDVLLILIPTLIFVFIWIIFSVFHNFVNSTISEATNIQINPIVPDFDTKTINSIKQREGINPLYTINQVITPTPGSSSPSSPSATPTLIPSPTPTISVSQNQSSSGGSLTQ